MHYEEKWKSERERKAFIALADGTIFHGVAFGAAKDAVGEVVFNTGMCGYQEILTDPSYAGQFVVLTYPEVGNYGVNPYDIESRGLWLSGLVIGELNEPSNYRSTKSLDDYLREAGKPGIYGIDTRALTEHIRDHGNQKAYLCVSEKCKVKSAKCDRNTIEDAAIAAAREWPGLDGQDYASRVTCEKPYSFSTGLTRLSGLDNAANLVNPVNPVKKIVCYDFGVKLNILRSLASWAHVTVVPAKTPAEEVLAMSPDGVFLSNGPADPAAVTYAIENIQKLLGLLPLNQTIKQSNNQTIPLMGICLGHQLLALACGAKTGRLKFGHHGCNHPVKNLATGKVEITSQNHNFAVLPDSIPDCLEVTHVNLNDSSIEGIRHKTLPAFSVQYHPESCPGPHDSQYLFNQFKQLILNHETH